MIRTVNRHAIHNMEVFKHCSIHSLSFGIIIHTREQQLCLARTENTHNDQSTRGNKYAPYNNHQSECLLQPPKMLLHRLQRN